ncbi:MAG TPA: HD domain-containing phosphohydrolase [Solirubrobacteraceae bacterium]|nr:HD domain-containing phosphohydrolase [Solirubrobacteraceae bacterium]
MVSPTFVVVVLATTMLGPASGVLASVIGELGSSARLRTKPRSTLLINLPAGVLPTAVAGRVIIELFEKPVGSAGFYAAIVLGSAFIYTANFGFYVLLRRLNQPDAEPVPLKVLIDSLPSAALTVAITIAGVAITLVVGNAGIAFALAGIFAFSYMMYLVDQSRHRAEQYVALSWGVLAGLLRALDIRDPSAARHAAAVARFSRDIASAAGMSDQEAELAHTAGLLHDIGRFALSDRVAERGRTLTDEDWVAIQQHPELGAEMLRDLGLYGPVAEIVLCHHERVDGRGYPQGLQADEIPEIAKIVSVAEVYDTLTASDTYRTQMSSFEALTELRRVSGSQLDGRYVELLAELLTGSGVEYRHADMVDFDAELNMERRIRQAGAGG